MYTYILADYVSHSLKNEIDILKDYDIISALMDYCEENDIDFSYEPCDTLPERLNKIANQTNHRIYIMELY